MTSFIIAPVWHDRRRNYGRLLFSLVSFVPVHLDSLVNRGRLLVWHARIIQVASFLVWAPLLWSPSFLLEVRPRSYRATCSRPAPIIRPADDRATCSSLEDLQPLGPLAARPPCEACEAFRGRISRAKRDTDQTPTPARIAPKNALAAAHRPRRAHLAPPPPEASPGPWRPF